MSINWIGENVFLINGARKNVYPYEREHGLNYFIPWKILKIDDKLKTIKSLEENLSDYLYDLEIGKDSIDKIFKKF